jgi:hypothetical protein
MRCFSLDDQSGRELQPFSPAPGCQGYIYRYRHSVDSCKTSTQRAYNGLTKAPNLVGDRKSPIDVRAGSPLTPEPRWRMSPIMMLAVIWAILTVMLIIVLIYRSTLSMHEDDQLFLDDSTSNLRAEQEQLLSKMRKVTPWVRILGAASGLLILVIAGMAIWQQMNRVY